MLRKMHGDESIKVGYAMGEKSDDCKSIDLEEENGRGGRRIPTG